MVTAKPNVPAVEGAKRRRGVVSVWSGVALVVAALAMAMPAQAQAPTLDSRVLTLERKVDSLGVWMEHCIADTAPMKVRTKHGVETVYALVMSKRQVRECLRGHG